MSKRKLRFGFYCAAWAVALMLSGSAASAADIPHGWNTVRHYEEAKKRGLLGTYLVAAAGAFLAANGELANKKQPLLYCVPTTLVLQNDNYIAIIEEQLAKMKSQMTEAMWDAPIEFLLLAGLEETFPCH
jgi:hypothetical protein